MNLFALLSPFLGRRVMVTGRASKTRREGSIPSRPAGSYFKGRMPGLHPGDASSSLADSTLPVVQRKGHRKTKPVLRRAGHVDLLRESTRGRGSRGMLRG